MKKFSLLVMVFALFASAALTGFPKVAAAGETETVALVNGAESTRVFYATIVIGDESIQKVLSIESEKGETIRFSDERTKRDQEWVVKVKDLSGNEVGSATFQYFGGHFVVLDVSSGISITTQEDSMLMLGINK